MSSKMLKFVSTGKAMPEKRKAEKRVSDFDEIYDDFDAAEAETQSSRPIKSYAHKFHHNSYSSCPADSNIGEQLDFIDCKFFKLIFGHIR